MRGFPGTTIRGILILDLEVLAKRETPAACLARTRSYRTGIRASSDLRETGPERGVATPSSRPSPQGPYLGAIEGTCRRLCVIELA
jgi:hypothetical protein